MANPTLFDINRGDVVLNAALLARIQSGAITLYLPTEAGEVRLDAAAVSAIQVGTKQLKILHSAHGHRTLNAATLNALS